MNIVTSWGPLEQGRPPRPAGAARAKLRHVDWIVPTLGDLAWALIGAGAGALMGFYAQHRWMQAKPQVGGGGGSRSSDPQTGVDWWTNTVDVHNPVAHIGRRRIPRQTAYGLNARLRDRETGWYFAGQLLWCSSNGSLQTETDLASGEQVRLYMTANLFDGRDPARWSVYDNPSRDTTQRPQPSGNRTWTEDLKFDLVIFDKHGNQWDFCGFEMRKATDESFSLMFPPPKRSRVRAVVRAARGKDW